MTLHTEKIGPRLASYREYFGDLPDASVRRILIGFVAGLLLVEVALRVYPVRHFRTAISSLHGGRWIYEETLRDPGPKVLGFGDSSLVGGGVEDVRRITAYRIAEMMPKGVRFFDLAVSGGDSSTSRVLLDALRRRGVANVDRCLIEILPTKFVVPTADAPVRPYDANRTLADMRTYFPDGDPWSLGMSIERMPMTASVDASLQVGVSRLSALYRTRDVLRTEVVGNYPVFWVAGRALPAGLRTRILGAKGAGTNRLGANVEDGPYDPDEELKPLGAFFKPGHEGTDFAACLDLARTLSKRPPVVLVNPVHYEAQARTPELKAQWRTALAQFDRFVDDVCRRKGVEVLRVPSQEFQDPKYWTRTPEHTNEAGHAEIVRRLEPALRRLFR